MQKWIDLAAFALSFAGLAAAAAAALPLTACAGRGADAPPAAHGSPASADAADPHSFAKPDEVAVRHLDLDLTVDFDQRRLAGSATLVLDRRTDADRVVLDTRDLEIRGVTLLADEKGGEGTAAEYTLGDEVEFLGRPLTVTLRPDTRAVRVDYATSPDAVALQWLAPELTAGHRHPALFSQSQAALARTWVPCQDTPGVRMTYGARVEVPPDLLALMSAENPQQKNAEGVYTFTMPQPIPSYLLAIAVGDYAFRPFDGRSGVYAEPSVVDAAAWELADTPRMMATAEALYGPYRWGRYDLLILPPSFPFGGMENPRLTFATPTILAGDRSLVSLVAHELAHSWSGNLVTNATWNDFWLNEGFTTYFENRIMEALYGRDYADMLLALGLQDLREKVAAMSKERPDAPDTRLHLDLAGRDADDSATDIPYEKGSALLRMLEGAVGRERWDAFLGRYFATFAFQSMTSARFLDYLQAELLTPEQFRDLHVEEWIYQPGLPPNVPEVRAARFERVDAQLAAWGGGTPAADLDVTTLDGGEWSTHEWLRFLRSLPDPEPADSGGAERMADLDAAFHFTDSGNSEILAVWLSRAVAAGYRPADPALERFLVQVGRRKFVAPLYGALARTPEGKARAREIYAKARPGYHPVTKGTVDQILGWGEAAR